MDELTLSMAAACASTLRRTSTMLSVISRMETAFSAEEPPASLRPAPPSPQSGHGLDSRGGLRHPLGLNRRRIKNVPRCLVVARGYAAQFDDGGIDAGHHPGKLAQHSVEISPEAGQFIPRTKIDPNGQIPLRPLSKAPASILTRRITPRAASILMTTTSRTASRTKAARIEVHTARRTARSAQTAGEPCTLLPHRQ